MRRAVSVVGVLMVLVGVVVAGLSLLTYADKEERVFAETGLEVSSTAEGRARAWERLRAVESRERLNISMAVGGSVFAAGGGAVLVAVRRRRDAGGRSVAG